MTMPLDKRKLLRYVAINFVFSLSIVLFLWYTGRFVKGILFYVGLFLDMPAFIIISFIGGINNAMHFTPENIYRVVSFIFYSLLIALIQIFIYKRRK